MLFSRFVFPVTRSADVEVRGPYSDGRCTLGYVERGRPTKMYQDEREALEDLKELFDHNLRRIEKELKAIEKATGMVSCPRCGGGGKEYAMGPPCDLCKGAKKVRVEDVPPAYRRARG